MHYYIDGYNLLFRVAGAGDDLQKQRQDIIQDLETKINLLELDVTLVFDAQYEQSESSRAHVKRLEICFTAVGETADDFILQALKAERRPTLHTVVTSDNKLAWLARRCHAKTESVEEFISWLNRRYKNKLTENKKETKSKKITTVTPLLITKAKPKPTPNPDKLPDTRSSPEECLDFYLTQFEKEYHTQVEQQTARKEMKKVAANPARAKKRKPPPKPKSDHDFLSEEERWKQAFQRSLEQDEEK